ncbi:Nucleotidyltransferase [Piedraia hortae CBS 480.64]|uniref:DNA polymerase n=1 Tax=Piedraia hortae CBS 480.64 TaxID=1314780 RepID=A0A6A7BRH1_9PEZI|nr:Nucleotidyltransferase [Piedraia hortae CBS 480.64]
MAPFDLSDLPPIYISATHFEEQELHRFEGQLLRAGANLTYFVTEAQIVLSKAEKKKRAAYDLRLKGLWTEDFRDPGEVRGHNEVNASAISDNKEPPRKRMKRIHDDSTIAVVKIRWFIDSRKANKVLPIENYIVYRGLRIDRSAASALNPPSSPPNDASTILERARADVVGSNNGLTNRRASTSKQRPRFNWQVSGEDIQLPDWVQDGCRYACQRCSPKDSPNSAFIALLTEIRLVRELTNDAVGVRAYSTSIASLASCPFRISQSKTILALPGCDAKIATLMKEWNDTGQIGLLEEYAQDQNLQILKLFHNIWGVGTNTAREFLYKRGWRDLENVVEFGWESLTRVQQIGVKYYEEFLEPIPRSEVKYISSVIQRHAIRVRDANIQLLTVGGYRRGKETCGDVDVIVSHPEEEKTLGLIPLLVFSLEEEGWITHTLTFSSANSTRDQQTLPLRSSPGGHGFDTLDKAFVVWKDIAKSSGPHRRVDIIVSPWKTVGCAVVGWTGDTTFERDLRRYAKDVKGWKFDSSGVRDRRNGQCVDIEGYFGYGGEIGQGPAMDMVQAEKRVFEGFGLAYREPSNRNTG